VFHTLALITMWQLHNRQKLDMIIQVGDFGAYPEPSEELRNDKFVKQDAAELDYSRLLKAEGKLADDIRYLRSRHVSRIHFIRGNHEDFDWLDSLGQSTEGLPGVSADPFELYHYVPDGTVWEQGDTRIAFLGGIETPELRRKSIDPSAYGKLLRRAPGEVDILITHDAPYGVSTGYHGETQGSALISGLIQTIHPRYLIAGHYHHVIGPTAFGGTTYLGLNVLVHLRDDAEHRRVRPGSMAVLNTETNDLSVVTDDWLSDIDRQFDFEHFMAELRKRDH